MQLCPNCAAELIPGAKFCHRCGDSIVEKTKACPACHEQSPLASVFCHHCGHHFEGKKNKAREVGYKAQHPLDFDPDTLTEQVKAHFFKSLRQRVTDEHDAAKYSDFVADPVGTIARFYAFARINLSGAGEQAMRDYLKNNRGDRYGKFAYSTAMIGVDIDELHREFAPYRQRFDLTNEQRIEQRHA